MTIGIDVPSVRNEEEALGLMIHHLGLAAAYFEASPESLDRLLEEINRTAESDPLGAESPRILASSAFVQEISKWYKPMAQEDETRVEDYTAEQGD